MQKKTAEQKREYNKYIFFLQKIHLGVSFCSLVGILKLPAQNNIIIIINVNDILCVLCV